MVEALLLLGTAPWPDQQIPSTLTEPLWSSVLHPTQCFQYPYLPLPNSERREADPTAPFPARHKDMLLPWQLLQPCAAAQPAQRRHSRPHRRGVEGALFFAFAPRS